MPQLQMSHKSEEKSGISIFSETLNWSFSTRLPYILSVFGAEFIAVITAFNKAQPASLKCGHSYDSLSLISVLASNSDPLLSRTFHFLVPTHKGLKMNEMADTLVKTTLSSPVFSIIPTTALLTRKRFQRHDVIQDSGKILITHLSEYRHLFFP